MSRTTTRTPPSHYPPLAFHLIRTFSLVSSLIVSGILLYFCYHLRHDHYKIPWTFLVVCRCPLRCTSEAHHDLAPRSVSAQPAHARLYLCPLLLP